MNKFAGDIIILHICTKKSQSYDVQFLRFGVRLTEFFVILDRFLPFYPPMDTENQHFEKMKKTPDDIINLQMCTINYSHMMYGSWDTECNRQKFLSFWIISLPFYPANNPKNHLEVSSFYNSVTKIWSYAIPFRRYGVWQI